MSVYLRQKQPVGKENNSVNQGFANLDQVCSKCGAEDSMARKCPHCGDVLLCRKCFYEKAHWEEYRLNYSGVRRESHGIA